MLRADGQPFRQTLAFAGARSAHAILKILALFGRDLLAVNTATTTTDSEETRGTRRNPHFRRVCNEVPEPGTLKALYFKHLDRKP